MESRDIALSEVKQGMFLLLTDVACLDPEAVAPLLCEPVEVIAVGRGFEVTTQAQRYMDMPVLWADGVRSHSCNLVVDCSNGQRILVCFPDDQRKVPCVNLRCSKDRAS